MDTQPFDAMLHLVFEESFHRIMKQSPRVGKAYFYQSIELISISRELARVQSGEMIKELKELIQTIDTTFTLTVEAKSSKLPQADKAVESSTTALKDYVVAHRIAILAMDELTLRMQKAKEKDEDALKRKAKIMSKVRNWIEGAKANARAEVSIYVNHSWGSPHVHYLENLTPDISLNVILFKLVEQKLIRLRSNPHFYRTIPSLKDYNTWKTVQKGGCLVKFSDRLDEVSTASKEVKLHVLMDRSTHISFEGSHTYRVFGNIWEYNERTYLKDIRGYLLEAEELRDELQTEVEMLTSSGSRISYKWEDVLKEAKSAKKNVVFRLAATKTERVDSGYLSDPASPASPALSYKPSELSPPTQLGRDPGPRMPSLSHLSSDQSSFPSKLHLMSMPIPDPTLQTDHSGPSRLLLPPILVSSSSTTSYHSANEENEGLEFRSHHFKDQNPRSGGSVRPSQPVHEIQSCPSSTPQHVIASQVGPRIERPLSATVTPGSQSAFQMPLPTTVASDAHIKSGLGKESDLSAHVPKPSSIPNDVSVSSRDAPKAIHDTSAESRRRAESRALDTNHAATSVNNSINGTPGKGARINGTSGSPQSSVPSQLTNRIRDGAVRRQGLVPEGERHHAQDPGRRSDRPGQDEGEAAPAFPSFPPTNVRTRDPARKREQPTEKDTKYGQAMPIATNEASSSTHFQHNGQSVPRRPATGTPAGRQSYISHPVPNNSTGPARNEFRELGQSSMAVDASTSPSGASSRNFIPVQPESYSDAGYRNLKMPATVAPNQSGSTGTVDIKMEGNGKNAVSDHLSQKVAPAPLGNRQFTTSLQPQPQPNSTKKKGWFTRVVEKVKSVWD